MLAISLDSVYQDNYQHFHFGVSDKCWPVQPSWYAGNFSCYTQKLCAFPVLVPASVFSSI